MAFSKEKFKSIIEKSPDVAFEAFELNYKNSKIQCYKFGTGKNITLCLPSYPFSGLYYHWVFRNFSSKDQTFITFDIPGWIGFSDDIFENQNFYMSDLIAIGVNLVNIYNPEKFNILGYSFGGMLAMELASIFDGRVKSLILVSTITDGYLAQQSRIYPWVGLMCKLKLYQVMKLLAYFWVKSVKLMSYQRNKTALEYLPIYEEMYYHTDKRILLESLYSLFHLNYSDFLRNINNETDMKIVVVNSKDESKMFYGQSKLMKELCPRAEYYVLNGDHISFIIDANHPEVGEFMNKVTRD